MAGVPRGTVKSMRVVAVDYRPAGIGWNANGGPGGGGLSCTPPAIGNGTWDVKRVLGEVPVAEDGSAAFNAPVRTPVHGEAGQGARAGIDGRRIADARCWVDLGVPFCGDYEEGALWNEADRAVWERCCGKREAGRTKGERGR